MTRSLRLLAGWLCIAAGFALVVMLGLGVFDPAGAQLSTDADPFGWPASLGGSLPDLAIGLGAFAPGP